jgi:hypothetical protein
MASLTEKKRTAEAMKTLTLDDVKEFGANETDNQGNVIGFKLGTRKAS